jgi:hypothetical protein
VARVERPRSTICSRRPGRGRSTRLGGADLADGKRVIRYTAEWVLPSCYLEVTASAFCIGLVGGDEVMETNDRRLSRLSDFQMKVMLSVLLVATCAVFLANLFQ